MRMSNYVEVTSVHFPDDDSHRRIVTDPPYGVRAGAKRQGRKDPNKIRKPSTLPDGTTSHE